MSKGSQKDPFHLAHWEGLEGSGGDGGGRGDRDGEYMYIQG